MARRTPNILVPDDDEPATLLPEAGAPEAEQAPKPVVKAQGMPKTVRIVLEEVENIPPTGQMFGLNGRVYCIRPGEPVDVPEPLLEVIDNAVMSRPVQDPATLKVLGSRDGLRFPYRVIRRAA